MTPAEIAQQIDHSNVEVRRPLVVRPYDVVTMNRPQITRQLHLMSFELQ
jgi:hypothetical protein